MSTYILWPENLWGKHKCQVGGGHLVLVLLLGGVVQQVQEQLQQVAADGRQQQEEQLERFNLTLLVRDGPLPLGIKYHQTYCRENQGHCNWMVVTNRHQL